LPVSASPWTPLPCHPKLRQVGTDTSNLRKADPKGRSALLADIQQGTRLRKVTQINDRSAPQIESSKGTNKEGGGSANSRGGSTPPSLGDLFAGGFPVLRPAGQRDVAVGVCGSVRAEVGWNRKAGPAPQPGGLSWAVAGAALSDKALKPQLAPLNLPPIPPPLPLLPPCGYPGLSADAASPTQDVREPPAPPPPPPPPPLYASCTPRSSVPAPPLPGANNNSEAPLLPPPKSPGFQAQPPKSSAQALPTPPAPPGSQPFLQKKRPGRGPESIPTYTPIHTCPQTQRSTHTHTPTHTHARDNLSLPPPPPEVSTDLQRNARPPKQNLGDRSQPTACSSHPPPPTHRTSGGKLNPPPAPPARSPTTELSSRSQQAPAWTPAQQPAGQLRNGSLHILEVSVRYWSKCADDFESKFTFHTMEDFPPPDEYKPCQKIYPSKTPRKCLGLPLIPPLP
uniref:WAS/WASL interacting protein family member 3 n=1 Tax=Mustela putorius furo TaxID=9669 RepID=M3Y0P6_MUSPF